MGGNRASYNPRSPYENVDAYGMGLTPRRQAQWKVVRREAQDEMRRPAPEALAVQPGASPTR